MANRVRAIRSSFLITTTVVVTALGIAVASVALLIAVGAGNFLTSQQTLQQPESAIAAIETGVVEETVSVQVHVVPASTLQIPASQLGEGVITRAAPATGTALAEGDALVSVNEAPVMIIQGAIPAYRGLGPGSRGNDVEQLQEFLVRSGYELTVDGVFGSGTASALADLYAEKGYPAATVDGGTPATWRDTGLPLSRYVFVATTPVLVGGECGAMGQAAEALKCTLTSQASTVLISDTSGQSLTGLPVHFRGAATTDANITVGEVAPPATTASPTETPSAGEQQSRWYSLRGLPPEVQANPPESASVVVQTSPEDGLRVPATALRETAEGASFIHEATNDTTTPSAGLDHPVEVVLCAGGYCAIQGDGLSAGMQVELLG